MPGIITPLAVSSLAQAFVSEYVGTAILLLLGVGVVANALLAKTGGHSAGTLFINVGWGIAVMAGCYFAAPTGGHLNPAVTIGILVKEWMLGNPVDYALVGTYLAAQMLGAMTGALLAWLAYKQHYDDPEADAAAKLGTFATAPGIRKPIWNAVTETIATFVLVGWCVIASLQDPKGAAWAPLGVTLLIVGIGASLGGPTGYAINPVRDLGPRIMHAILPIKGKGSSDWGYAWVPIVGPLLGGLLAGLIIFAIYRACGILPQESAPFYQLASK